MSTRSIDLPRFLRIVEGRDQLVATLREVVGAIASDATVVSGSGPSKSLGAALAESLGAALVETPVNSRFEVDRVAAAISGTSVVVAVGGGRPIDVAKAAALIAGKPLVVVPTQLTADGISSPIAVIQENARGNVSSERAVLPVAVVADLETVASAPVGATRAGFGDLLANSTALVDWRLAAAAGKGEVDDFASLLSDAAFRLVCESDVTSLGAGEVTIAFAKRLLEGLVLSGLAMEVAGNSRPCSGAEHLISHALDELVPGTASHGEQVAFGAIVACELQGGDWQALRGSMCAAGLTRALEGFELAREDLLSAILRAPTTRSGRYTVLDVIGDDRQRLRRALDTVLDS